MDRWLALGVVLSSLIVPSGTADNTFPFAITNPRCELHTHDLEALSMDAAPYECGSQESGSAIAASGSCDAASCLVHVAVEASAWALTPGPLAAQVMVGGLVACGTSVSRAWTVSCAGEANPVIPVAAGTCNSFGVQTKFQAHEVAAGGLIARWASKAFVQLTVCRDPFGIPFVNE